MNDTSNIKVKLLISLCAAGVIFARIVLPNLKLDAVTLGLLVVAVLPWFSELLRSAELPGGWKVEFRDLERKQEVQGEQIREIRFLLESFLSQNQLNCLQALQSGHPFLFKKSSSLVEPAKDDLRRLFSTGLIDRKPQRGFRTLFDDGPDEQDVNEHFYITAKGQEFLKLLFSSKTDLLE